MNFLRFFSVIYIFMMSSIMAQMSVDEIYKGLMASHYKERRAAFKEALNLPYEQMSSLIKSLRKSNDPELNEAARRLQKEVDKIEKDRVYELPKNVEFTFYHERRAFESHNFRILFLPEDYVFTHKALILLKVIVDDKVFEGDALKNIRASHYTSNGKSCISWSIQEGKDNIFPSKPGKYNVQFIVQTPKQKWSIKREFARTKEDNPKALEAFVDAGLAVFLDNYFYKENPAKEKYKKAADFVKKYGESRLAKTIGYRFENAITNWVYGSIKSFDLIKNVCFVINSSKSSRGHMRLVQLKDQNQKSSRPNLERQANIEEVEKLLKATFVKAPEELTLKMPEVVFPRKLGQLKIQVNSKDYSLRQLQLYKAEIDGKDSGIYSSQTWFSEATAKGNGYYLTSPVEFLPNKEGEYELTLKMAMGDKLIEFKKHKFKVQIPAAEARALQEFERLGLSEYYKAFRASKLEGVNFEKAIAFSKRFPDSYLNKSLIDIFQKIAVGQIESRFKLGLDQQDQLAHLLKDAEKGPVLSKVAYVKKYYNRDAIRLKVAEFWFGKLIDGIPMAPEFLKLSTEQKKCLPYEEVTFKMTWPDKNFSASEMELVSLVLNGKDQELPKSSGSSSSSNYKTVRFREYSYDEPGEYEFDSIWVINQKVYRFPKFKLLVQADGIDQEAFKNIPVKAFKDFMKNARSSNFVIKDDQIFDFVSRFPGSKYVDKISEKLKYFPYYDAMGYKKSITQADRQVMVKLLNLLDPMTNLSYLKSNSSGNKLNEDIKKFWLDNLKVQTKKAPADLSYGFPKVLYPFQSFNAYIHKSATFKGGSVNLGKILIGDYEYVVSGTSQKRTMWWERMSSMPFKAGTYPLKFYAKSDKGYFLFDESEVKISSSKSLENEAYKEFVELGIAQALSKASYYDIFNVMSQEGMPEKILGFVKKYPKNFYTGIIANRLCHGMRYSWVSKLNDQQLKDFAAIINVCGRSLIQDRIRENFSKGDQKKKNILNKLKDLLEAPLVENLNDSLKLSFEQTLLPYQQLNFKSEWTKADGRPNNIYISYINTGKIKSAPFVSQYKNWLDMDTQMSWYLKPKFYKKFHTEEGDYEMDVCFTDMMKFYKGKLKFKIVLPESEREAFTYLEDKKLLSYFKEKRGLLNNKPKFSVEHLIGFSQKFPDSKYREIIKERLIYDWNQAHPYDRHYNAEGFLKVFEAYDKNMASKFRIISESKSFAKVEL